MALENTERKKIDVEIREMGIDDVPAVYHLGEALFTSEEYPILYRTWDPYEVTDYFTSYPEYCLVAETEGKIVGFILADIIEKEGTAWKKYGYVAWIGVSNDYQRTNLGHRLYNKLEDTLQEEGVRMVIADTDADNSRAINFFDTMGFSKAAQHVWLVKTFPTSKQKEDAQRKKRAKRLKTDKRLSPKH